MSEPTSTIVPAEPPSAPAPVVAAPGVVASEATPPAIAPKGESPPASSSFVEMKRQEREHRRAVEVAKRAHDEAKAALEKREAELASRLAKAEGTEAKLARISRDPLAALAAAGVDVDTIAQQILAGGAPRPETLIEESNEKLRAEIEAQIAEKVTAALKARDEEGKKTRQEQVFADFRKDSVAFIKADATKYPLLNVVEGAPERVVEELVTLFNQDPTHPLVSTEGGFDEACKNAETFYRNMFDKARAVIEPKTPEAPAADAGPPEKAAATERTRPTYTRREERPVISNKMTPSAPAAPASTDSWAEIVRASLAKHGVK